jgi:hypothetical protein
MADDILDHLRLHMGLAHRRSCLHAANDLHARVRSPRRDHVSLSSLGFISRLLTTLISALLSGARSKSWPRTNDTSTVLSLLSSAVWVMSAVLIFRSFLRAICNSSHGAVAYWSEQIRCIIIVMRSSPRRRDEDDTKTWTYGQSVGRWR